MSPNLKNFEKAVKDSYGNLELDLPRGSIKILDPSIITILVKNSSIQRTVEYSSNDKIYIATFSSYSTVNSNGMIGYYTDPPKNENIKEITFIVVGFHSEWDTEVKFSKEYMAVMPDRELKHLINFQRAILKTGIINKQ
ncbi:MULTISPECIES: hypothetical protein [unclassified Acidiplasma]|uniref:hypothetical protein n=1 Tax=unclassified Acidiplasma TaxID=2641301 RepID=UPI0005E53FEC|nr:MULTISPECIES: hypothetical protein [unclassified Acidiplasma]KJE49857.1 hypothetical protein TZ01_01860 [Acidiplasma sp. MBA-1]WMT55022.1 MAG: hypothetical protein RE470_08935 [Acidiplasma sp.]